MLILTLVGIRYKELPPEFKFIDVVISLLLLVVIAASFIYAIMARYAAVLERTQEIGIFRFLGASSAYIFSLLFQESLIFAISGTTVGIAMAYGIKGCFPQRVRLAHVPNQVANFCGYVRSSSTPP